MITVIRYRRRWFLERGKEAMQLTPLEAKQLVKDMGVELVREANEESVAKAATVRIARPVKAR